MRIAVMLLALVVFGWILETTSDWFLGLIVGFFGVWFAYRINGSRTKHQPR